jgi:ornithine racemase
MYGPEVIIDLAKIERNARTVVETCRAAGIGVFGVTKGTCGMPQVARAMLRGGVAGIGESRFENIRRLRASGIDGPIMLLRSPPLSRIEEVITTVDISLNSELAVAEELSRVAERMGRVHDIILMVDLGDLREGIWPSDVLATVERVLKLPGVRLAGIGTNLTCFGAILPSEENMGELARHAREIEERFGLELAYVSGGGSSSLPLLLAGKMPARIDNLRIGEAILQGGRETFLEAPWEALEPDAFLLSGELLEVKLKPSVPIGRAGLDAFGQRPVFEDRGLRLRGIVNIGREDVVVEGLEPTAPGVAVLGASSDHLVVDLGGAEPPPRVGDALRFRMSYGALLSAMTSEYVEKTPMFDQPPGTASRKLGLFVEPELMEIVKDLGLVDGLAALGFCVETKPVALGAEPPAVSAIGAALEAGAVPLLFGIDHLATLRACGRSPPPPTPSASSGSMPGRASCRPAVKRRRIRATACSTGRSAMSPGLPRCCRSCRPRPWRSWACAKPDRARRRSSGTPVSRSTPWPTLDALGIGEVMRRALRLSTRGEMTPAALLHAGRSHRWERLRPAG